MRRTLAALSCATALCAALPAAARAADSIYWGNDIAGTIRVANLDGSGAAANLFAGESGPHGVAIDPSANRIYWADDNNTIRVANLDGSGAAANLFAGESIPAGVAIDPAANRIYWANAVTGTIRVANLDGTGAAADLFAGESDPIGVAIDPAANRIYWVNNGNDTIRVANLDGSGAAATLFAGESDPRGVAIDPAANRIYWADPGNNTIRVANLDGTGAAQTLFTEVGGSGPVGVAIDPAGNRIYWANFSNSTIRVANLDGSGAAANLFAGESAPRFPALLRTPLGAGAPVISGGGGIGQQLSCGQGAWAADLLGAFLFRAPRSFSHQWLRDGAAIPGATMSSFTPTEAGSYSCRVTATNQAGSAAQTSAAVQVSAAGQVSAAQTSAPNDFSFGKPKKNANKGIAHLPVDLPGPGQIGYRGQGEDGAGSSRAIASRDVAVAGRVWLKIKSGRFGKRSGEVRRQLKRGDGKAKVKILVTYKPAGGTSKTTSRRLKLVRKR